MIGHKVAVLLTVALLLTGCERLLGDKGEPVSVVDREVAERVLAHVLDRMEKAHEKVGPIGAFDLPEHKRLAAEAEGFESWMDFKKRLQKTDPSLDIEYARRITRRMSELLEPPQEKAGEEDG